LQPASRQSVGLLLIAPIWLMLLHTNLYLWGYPLV